MALFVALNSTAVAAVTLQKNSVLSRHIKDGQVKNGDLAKNSVDSNKVRNATLRAEDFAANQIPAGPQGPQGVQGPEGKQGVEGPPNPNADFLDGLNSDAFALAGHNHDAAYVNEGQADAVTHEMVNDLTRTVNLPLSSFHICDGTGQTISYSGGAGDATPQFNGSGVEAKGPTIRFDATAGSPDQDTEICTQFIAPADMAESTSPGTVIVRRSHSNTAAPAETLRCRGAVSSGNAAPGQSVSLAGTAICNPFASGNVPIPNEDVTISLSIEAAGAMNDLVDIRGVAFRYQATQ